MGAACIYSSDFVTRVCDFVAEQSRRRYGCRVARQWRSQECELGGLSSLAPSLLPSPPPFNGSGGITPGNFLKLKVLIGEF